MIFDSMLIVSPQVKVAFVDEDTLGFTVADSYGEQVAGSAADALEVDVDGRELVFSGVAELQGKLPQIILQGRAALDWSNG